MNVSLVSASMGRQLSSPEGFIFAASTDFEANFTFDSSNFSDYYEEVIVIDDVIVIEDPLAFGQPWKHKFFYTKTMTYLVTLLLGAFGNGAVIALMAGDRKARTTTNMFLVSLSVADLLMLLLCVPLEIVYSFVILWDSGGAACKMGKYFQFLSATASVLNLTAVSLERFIVIVFPMRSRSVCTLSNCRRSVVFVWAVSLVIACPIIWVTDVETDTYTNPNRTITVVTHYCSDFDSLGFLIYQLLVLFVIPGLLMIVFYTSVIRELWKSTKNIKALTNSARSRGVNYGGGNETFYLRVMTESRHHQHHHPPHHHLQPHHQHPVSGGPAVVVTGGDGNPSGGGDGNRGSGGDGGLRANGSFHVNGRLLGAGGDSAYNSSTSLYVPYGSTTASSHLRTPSPTSRTFTKKSREKGEDVKKARKQVIKMLIMVVVLFLLCWGSRLAFELIIVLKLQIFDQIFYTCKVTFWLLPFVHCCINPVIYCFMSKNFRRSMMRLLGNPCQSSCGTKRGCCGCCLRGRRPPPRPLLTRATTRSLYSSCSPDNCTRHTDMEIVSSI